MRHEEVAAFAADAEAHLTGSLTVFAGSCDPGNLHLTNGLFDRHRFGDSGAGDRRAYSVAGNRQRLLPGTHPELLFKECSHYCELISGANQMLRTLETAIREAPANAAWRWR